MFYIENTYLLILLPLPFLIRMLIKPYRDIKGYSLRIPFFKFIQLQNQNKRDIAYKYGISYFSYLFAWFSLVIAIASPKYVGSLYRYERNSHNIVFALDISGSMAIPDFLSANGNRIKRIDGVKEVSLSLMEKRKNDNMGLVVFSDFASLYVAPTYDYTALEIMTSELQIGFAGYQTALYDGIATAVNSIKNLEGDKIIILISDGNDSSSKLKLSDIKTLIKQSYVKVYSIAIGSSNPLDFVKEEHKEAIKIKIDEEILRDISEISGGKYYNAESIEQLNEIYNEINSLEDKNQQELNLNSDIDISYIFIALSMLLIFISCISIIIRNKPNKTAVEVHDE